MRRFEATVAALVLDKKAASRRLMKLMTPVRKAAGKVRDMDVLIGDVLALSDQPGGEGLIRLVEHLAKMRVRNARKLYDAVRRQRQQTQKRLKQSMKLFKKKLQDDSAAVNGEAVPQILIAELRSWPELNASNLHTFRIRIKELRYMLQLNNEADAKLMERLDDVKNAIGEWHDWLQLSRIAGKVLDPDPDSRVLNQIERIGKEKLAAALASANQLREHFFDAPTSHMSSRKVLNWRPGSTQKAAGF